jgi:predicted nucleic acid-binding protein
MQPTLFAADTNFLLDLALPRDIAHDAHALIRRRVPGAQIVATQTVLDELEHFATRDARPAMRALAAKALGSIPAWHITPVLLTDTQSFIAERIAGKLRDQGIIPGEERSDSHVLAETALLGCQILVSADSHLRDADRTRLALALQSCDVPVVVVCKPVEIVSMFSGR